VAVGIGASAFSGCSSLTSVSLPMATNIGASAFSGCSSLATVSLPVADGIGNQAFSGCTGLTSVTLEKAASIGDSAFSGCSTLATVSLPVATIIGESAFASCAVLATVSLPKVTHIKTKAFSSTGTTGLTITLGASTPPLLGINMFNGVNSSKNVTVKVPSTAAGYGSSPSDTNDNWGNAFRGKGWDGGSGSYLNGTVNANISLTIQSTS
jgi:hypothetical protein